MRTIRGNAGDGGKGAWSPMKKQRGAEMFYYAYPVRFLRALLTVPKIPDRPFVNKNFL